MGFDVNDKKMYKQLKSIKNISKKIEKLDINNKDAEKRISKLEQEIKYYDENKNKRWNYHLRSRNRQGHFLQQGLCIALQQSLTPTDTYPLAKIAGHVTEPGLQHVCQQCFLVCNVDVRQNVV
jgi:hypothetical protein